MINNVSFSGQAYIKKMSDDNKVKFFNEIRMTQANHFHNLPDNIKITFSEKKNKLSAVDFIADIFKNNRKIAQVRENSKGLRVRDFIVQTLDKCSELLPPSYSRESVLSELKSNKGKVI